MNEEKIKQLGPYNLTSEFMVAAIDDDIIDIILRYSWLETLGMINFHVKKTVMTLSEGKKSSFVKKIH